MINPTEERVLNLLFTLYKNPAGLNFEQIKQKLKSYYSNENDESDQRKLSRDIEILNEIGFNAKFRRTNYQSFEKDVYLIERDFVTKKIELSEEELTKLSALLLKNFTSNTSLEIYTACQKLFKKNLEQFPFSFKKPSADEEIDSKKEIISNLLNSIKYKNPIKMEYSKQNKNEISTIEIDPIQITKRVTEDTYLLGFDRKNKKIKRYLIPKIKKVTSFNEEFIFNGKLTDNDLNYHSLNFSIHDPIRLEIIFDLEQFWKLESFLFPHQFEVQNDKLILNTKNKQALFPFLIKEPTAIKKINSKELIEEFRIFKNKIIEGYNVF